VADKYQALLFVSFGGPDGPEDVIPFLENVLRGRNVPRERMLAVAEHYNSFGGKSPINEQNLALIEALKPALAAAEIDLPIYFGNRNWHPLLPDTVREMQQAGVSRALAFVTSGFSCYSGCRQYRENIATAIKEVGAGAPEVEKIRVFHNHPLFLETVVELVQDSISESGVTGFEYEVVFCAHSIPDGMAKRSAYEIQLREAARIIAEKLELPHYSLAFQSRSGPPTQAWLEPDICDHLSNIKESGRKHVFVMPLGFISDHMEVIYDLDHEAKDHAADIGLGFTRVPTPGVHPKFVQMIVELVKERLSDSSERACMGTLPPNPDRCPGNCCLPR